MNHGAAYSVILVNEKKRYIARAAQIWKNRSGAVNVR